MTGALIRHLAGDGVVPTGGHSSEGLAAAVDRHRDPVAVGCDNHVGVVCPAGLARVSPGQQFEQSRSVGVAVPLFDRAVRDGEFDGETTLQRGHRDRRRRGGHLVGVAPLGFRGNEQGPVAPVVVNS